MELSLNMRGIDLQKGNGAICVNCNKKEATILFIDNNLIQTYLCDNCLNKEKKRDEYGY